MPQGHGHFGGHHHGGGHHGGGHHGGGHFGHHRHPHHRPFLSRPVVVGPPVVFTGWWFPWRYDGGRAILAYTMWLLCFFFLFLIIFLTIALVLQHNNDGFTTQYAPLDTEIISYSQSWCDGIQLEDPDILTPATIYRLNSKPSLTSSHRFTLSGKDNIPTHSYAYWYYYLHVGSSMTLNICLTSGTSVGFYIIKGTESFEDWADGYDSYISFQSFGSLCQDSNDTTTFIVDSDDQYFFAFTTEDSRTVNYKYVATFYRTEYGVQSSQIEESCNAGGGYGSHCTVSMPYTGNHVVMISVGNTSSPDGFRRGIDVNWSCNPRVWLYLVAFAVPPVSILLILLVVFVSCYCCQNRRKMETYSTLQNEPVVNTATTTTVFTAPTATAPPPPYAPPTTGTEYGATDKLP